MATLDYSAFYSTSQFSDSIWRISVERYHAMIDAGIFTPEDKIELMFGRLIEKPTVNPRHRIATSLAGKLLGSLVPDEFHVLTQQPMTTEDSEPEPDVLVVRGQIRDYLERHPYAEDVPIVVEVSDATLQRDQTVKKALYAQAGVAVYWIVNLVHAQVEVYSKPGSGMYAELRAYRGEDVIPVVIDGVDVGNVPVASILP